MITRRMAAALVAGSMAVGLVAGTAGSIIAKDATPTQDAAAACLEHMDDMDSMMAGQNGMMPGAGGMMGGAGMMSGTGGMMGGQSGSGAMPDWMQQHHAASTPAPVR